MKIKTVIEKLQEIYIDKGNIEVEIDFATDEEGVANVGEIVTITATNGVWDSDDNQLPDFAIIDCIPKTEA